MYNNNSFEYDSTGSTSNPTYSSSTKNKMTAGGYNISKGRALGILGIWIIVTISIALMVAYIPDHSCSDPDNENDITSTFPDSGVTTMEPATEFPPQGDGPWMDPFLNEAIRPKHYDLYLDPDFYFDGSTFKGRENITIDVGIETRHLIVHYKYMNITRTAVWDEQGRELDVEETFSYDTHEYWITSLVEAVTTGSTVTLHLEFEGSLVNGIVGYYKSTYVNMDTGVER